MVNISGRFSKEQNQAIEMLLRLMLDELREESKKGLTFEKHFINSEKIDYLSGYYKQIEEAILKDNYYEAH